MKIAALTIVFVAVATAAPVEKSTKEAAAAPVAMAVPVPLIREKRSSYGAVYTPPCAAAQIPAYGLPSLSPHVPSYGYNPHAAYAAPSYGAPHYRADDAMMSEDGEMMSFSDHMMARSYGYDAPAAQYGGQVYGPSSAAGPAVGVFPNAHVSGCNVPLLLSCSPSIVAGKIVSQPSYGGSSSYAVVPAAAPAPAGYRGVDEHHMGKEGAVEEHHDDHAMMAAHHEQRMTAQEAGHAPPMHS